MFIFGRCRFVLSKFSKLSLRDRATFQISMFIFDQISFVPAKIENHTMAETILDSQSLS